MYVCPGNPKTGKALTMAPFNPDAEDMKHTPFPPTICCPIRITVTEQRKDSEILDAGEREHEEMNDITAI